MADRKHTSTLLHGIQILFIDDDYVNFLYFNELLGGSGSEVMRAVSVSQAIYKLKYENAIRVVFMSAEFAERFNYSILRFFKDRFPDLPIITIIDDQSSKAQKRCIEEGSDCYIHRHIDNNHLVELIMDNITSDQINSYANH
jgi:CheY-like chemotaxis protein